MGRLWKRILVVGTTCSMGYGRREGQIFGPERNGQLWEEHLEELVLARYMEALAQGRRRLVAAACILTKTWCDRAWSQCTPTWRGQGI